ncbi:hypothetical protein IAT40_007744 [Kwoniella sp. CBS 6097]
MTQGDDFQVPALRLPADLDFDADIELSPTFSRSRSLQPMPASSNSDRGIQTQYGPAITPEMRDYFSFNPNHAGEEKRGRDITTTHLHTDAADIEDTAFAFGSDWDSVEQGRQSRERPSLLPPRNSLPPPPRIRSASTTGSRTFSAQSSRTILLTPGNVGIAPHTYTCSHLHDQRSRSESRIDFSLPVPVPMPMPISLSTSRINSYGGMASFPDTASERVRERCRSAALNKLEANTDDPGDYSYSDLSCPCRSLRANNSNRPSFLSIDTNHARLHQSPSSTSSPLETRKSQTGRGRFKTPRTPRFVQHALDHLNLKDHKHNPLQSRFAQMVVPTHVHLPTPILPIIHLLLIIAHLILSALIPYLLVKWFIQPLVLWVIAVVTIALECFYLVPGIVLELIGLLRRKPIESAWLQSGINLVIMILALAPHSLTVFLLFTANQVPECPSVILYKEPKVANFETHLRWSTCAVLPKVTMMGLVNLVVLLCEIIVTSFAVGLDYRIQRKEERRHSKMFARESTSNMRLDEKEVEQKKKRRRTWWRETPEDRARAIAKIRRRRWTTGVGRLLWDIEGFVHRRKAKQREERAK